MRSLDKHFKEELIKKKNILLRIIYAFLLTILSIVIVVGISNGKKSKREGHFVYVKPLNYYMTNTRYRSVIFKFEYESNEFKRTISYDDYKTIKNLDKVKMFYFDKRGSFDLNTTPNTNARLGILDYILILLPIPGVIYNLYKIKV